MRWKKFLAGLLLFVLMIVTVLTVSAEEAAGSLMENLHYNFLAVHVSFTPSP